MKKQTAYLLGGAAVLGGIGYYAVTRKKENGSYQGDCPPGFHRMPDGTCMADSDMPVPAMPPELVPFLTPELIAQYDACFNAFCSPQVAQASCSNENCTPEQYRVLINHLRSLMTSQGFGAESVAFLNYFVDALLQKWGEPGDSGGDITSQSAGLGLNFGPPAQSSQFSFPPPLPGNFPVTLAFSYTKCWYEVCPIEEFETLLQGMNAYIRTTTASNAAQVTAARDALMGRRIRQTNGTRSTMGRHVGACACQQRQEEIGTGACCDSCAEGKECEECAAHEHPPMPTVG